MIDFLFDFGHYVIREKTMRISARAIIIKEGKLLTMFRRKVKGGQVMEYYVIPGGGVEEGESLQETVIRELKEEMSVDIKILGYLGCIGDAHYFHCEIVNGKPQLGGEEFDRMTNENFYRPEYIQIDELPKVELYGKEFVRKALDKTYEIQQ